MKTFTKLPLFLILLLALLNVFFVSCEKTEPDHRDDFIGTYTVEEYSITRGRMSVFQSRIIIDSQNPDEILIRNFYGVGIDVSAVVMGSKIFIPDQQVSFFEITRGQGSLNIDETILLEYYVTTRLPNSEPVTDFLEATYIPQF